MFLSGPCKTSSSPAYSAKITCFFSNTLDETSGNKSDGKSIFPFTEIILWVSVNITAISSEKSRIISPILYEAAYYATSKAELLGCIAIEVISLLWAALIIRDALGIRMAVENNAQITHTALTDIPELISSLLPKKIQEKWVKPLPNSIKDKWANLASELNIDTGHRPHEVFGGCLLAIILGTGANAIKTSNWSWLIIDIIIAIIYVAFSYLILAKVYKNNSENKGKEK